MNEYVIRLESESTAVYVTVVTPREKVSPGLWLDVRVTTPELSLAVGNVHVTTAVTTPPSVDWIISAGIPRMTGSSSSKKDGGYCKSSCALIRLQNSEL